MAPLLCAHPELLSLLPLGQEKLWIQAGPTLWEDSSLPSGSLSLGDITPLGLGKAAASPSDPSSSCVPTPPGLPASHTWASFFSPQPLRAAFLPCGVSAQWPAGRIQLDMGQEDARPPFPSSLLPLCEAGVDTGPDVFLDQNR